MFANLSTVYEFIYFVQKKISSKTLEDILWLMSCLPSCLIPASEKQLNYVVIFLSYGIPLSLYSWQTVLCRSLIHWSALPGAFSIRPLSAEQAVGTHQFLDGGQKTAEEGLGCVCCSLTISHSLKYKLCSRKLGFFSSLDEGRWVSIGFVCPITSVSVIHIVKYSLTF